MTQRKKLLISDSYPESVVQKLQQYFDVNYQPDIKDPELKQIISDYDALLIRTYTNVTGELIKLADSLQVIGRGGVGLDNVDLTAAESRNITILHTPGAATQSVTELVISFMVSLSRHIKERENLLRENRFMEGRNLSPGMNLSGKSLGIIGMGTIGRHVATVCHSIGMNIFYYDILAPDKLDLPDIPVASIPIEEILSRSDFISLHVPLNENTFHLINKEKLSLMKPEAFLINTARGKVVDTISLAESLQENRLAGAALDVFEEEPLSADHPILHAPNTILTPHIGAKTRETQEIMYSIANKLIEYFE